MVEKLEANINDTGVLSKEDAQINIKSCSEEREVTDYWDISGAMDNTSGCTRDLRGNIKLHSAANGTTAGDADAIEHRAENDDVTLPTADIMKTTYCENGQCAISETGPNLSDNLGNNNNNNNNANTSVTQLLSSDSKDGELSENSDPFANSQENNKGNSNMSRLQREYNPVGTEEDNTKREGNDVSDTVSQNIMIQAGADNCPDGENKIVLSIQDKMLLGKECPDERIRIDRKKLEQMLQAASEGRGQSGEVFFKKIMDDTNTFISWPSKLKIGAKSKKDPHIRIWGEEEDIKEARKRIMLTLDTKSNRVTVKMDVSHTEHSHVIGKGGNNIKRVMQETGCHIHFPDSNRNTAGEKSNQVSIAGHPVGVENARSKIRSLLPIMLQFEIPNTGLPIPDLNSSIIQHLVQVYGISIQFKQHAKVYSTSCTVRGSADNTEGLKTGVQTLMTHVARTQLAVTTQIEIAPQHHNYMLTKPGLNVTTITQTTGARIIFPDPTALPKKSTVYISGATDSVILARHKLMGCLPLLLMFDTKNDYEGPNNDAMKIANMMETLDLHISIKSKPRQPSQTVMIKSIEHNIYNMFEARGKILGLDSSGVTRPVQSQSPKLSKNVTITPTPVILLAHSHVPTPTVQTAVIGMTEQRSVTPISILGNPSYVLTSNPVTPRPVSASLSAVHTPSQSPFPTLPNSNIPNHLISKSVDLIQRNDNIVNKAYQLTGNNMSPPSNTPMTRSTSFPNDQQCYQINVTSPQQMQRQIGQKSNMAGNSDITNSVFRADNPYMYHQNHGVIMQNGTSQLEFEAASRQTMYSGFSIGDTPKTDRPYGNNRVMLSNYDSRSVHSSRQLLPNNEDRIEKQELEQKMNEHLLRQSGNHYGNNQRILSEEDLLRQQLGISEQPNPVQSSNVGGHMLNSGNTLPSGKSGSHFYGNDQRILSKEDLLRQQLGISEQPNPVQSSNVGGHMLNSGNTLPSGKSGSHFYGNDQRILSKEDLLRQQLGISEQPNPVLSSNVGGHMLNSGNTSPSSNVRQSLAHNIHSPDSICESRASLTSERNSPSSSFSDRYDRRSNSRLGTYGHFDEQPVHRGSPPPVNPAGNFQSLTSRDRNRLSPSSNISHHRSPPHIVLNQNSQGRLKRGSLPNNYNPGNVGDLYPQMQQSMDDISSGPPPGFEGFTTGDGAAMKTTDYDNLCKLAKKAMENKPVPSEVRTPTDIWSGWGFSKSMPFEMKEELEKLALSKGRFRSNLPTTYENGEIPERDQPSPVDEESEYGVENSSPNRLRVPFESGIGKSGSNLTVWRRRRLANMDLSFGGNMGLNYISSVQRPSPQKNSAFTPIHPNESFNRSSNNPTAKSVSLNETTPQTRPVINSPFNNSGNENASHFPLSEKAKNYNNRINMSSTPTIQDSLGLKTASTAPKVEPDISDVLNRLDLSKYILVFQQQEVDYQTFLTLTEPDLKELGITTFGPRKKILLAIKDLNKDRDVFSGSMSNDSTVNLSDQMLQLQRLQLQQHRDNTQTTAQSRLDTHQLLSPSRQLFDTQAQRMQNHPDRPAMDSGFYERNNQQNNDRMRSVNASRLWQNSRTGGSSSGRW